jgi:hypothetical protein
MKIIESNRRCVLETVKNRKIYCHRGCNLCCHGLTLTVDPLDSYVLTKVFETVPYDELFPYYRKCAGTRLKAEEYLNSRQPADHEAAVLNLYDELGFTTTSCPFVDEQKGCLIHDFNPQICFSYFSGIPCKTVMKSGRSGLENDSGTFYFNDKNLVTYERLEDMLINENQDKILDQILSHSVMLEMLTIVSIALQKSNPEKYHADTKGWKLDLRVRIDGNMRFLHDE